MPNPVTNSKLLITGAEAPECLRVIRGTWTAPWKWKKGEVVASFTPSQGLALDGILLIALQMLIKFSSEKDIGFLFFFRGSSLDG